MPCCRTYSRGTPMHHFKKDTNNLINATIMIVDDEPINIEVVQAFLEERGYHNFVTVEDSTTAIKILEKTRPDLILLDLKMPVVSGFDILKIIRNDPRFKYLPIIIKSVHHNLKSPEMRQGWLKLKLKKMSLPGKEIRNKFLPKKT